MFTSAFLKDAAERAISTFAEAAAPAFVGASVFDIDYKYAFGIAASASVLALCKTIAAAYVGDKGTASLVRQ